MIRRTLSAVLAADVVGYSRLMSDDAEGTLQTLRRLRTEILVPVVAARRGRVVKSMGDGWIVVFTAISDAVECAMQVQDQLKIDGAMMLRMGVHLGDVAEADDDVFGDGVNIAARLQALAEPGALAISGAARALLDNTLKPSFEDAGERELKNIDEPVPVWVRGGDLAGAKAALESAGLPRLALVPIATHDERSEVRDLAAALTGDLANFLNLLRYISGRTTETPEPDEYVLRAMLRARGERVRLEAWLQDPDGQQIQSEKFDGDLADVFDWQDDTSRKLAQSVLDRVTTHRAAMSEMLSPEECSAEQLMIRAHARQPLDGPSFRHFVDLIGLAIKKRPDWGYPYAWGGLAVPSASAIGLGSHVADYQADAVEWAKKAEELEPEFSPVRIMLTFVNLIKTGDREQTKRQVRTVMRNLPFDPEAMHQAAWVHNFIDEPQEALKYIRQLEKGVSSLFIATSAINARTMAHVLLGEFEEAILHSKRMLEIAPDYPPPWRFLAASYGNLGEIDKAKAALERLLQVSDNDTISTIRERAGYTFLPSPGLDKYMDGLRQAGMAE